MDPCSFARKTKWRPKSETWLKGTRKTTGKRFQPRSHRRYRTQELPTRPRKQPKVYPAGDISIANQRQRSVGLADSGIMPPMKYWEVIADKLSAAGWSWGYCSAVTRDGWRWIADTHRDGRRCIVHSDELLSVFLELKGTLR